MNQAVAVAVTPQAIRWPLVLGVAGIVAVYAPIFPSLAQEWATYPSLSHGFAIPVIAAYLIWTRRDSLAATPVSPTWRGLPVLVAGLAAYAVGTLGSEPFLERMSFPLALAGGLLTLAGPRITRQIAPGIGYLYFMMPLPYLALKSVIHDARLFDAWATATVLPWLGVPVLRQGVLLHLPNMTLEVADACTSVPAVASLLALGGAYGFVRRRPAAITLALLAVAFPLGVASNQLRIVLTAAGAYYLGPIAVHNVIHTWHGTAVFLMTFATLGLVDAGLARLVQRR